MAGRAKVGAHFTAEAAVRKALPVAGVEGESETLCHASRRYLVAKAWRRRHFAPVPQRGSREQLLALLSHYRHSVGLASAGKQNVHVRRFLGAASEAGAEALGQLLPGAGQPHQDRVLASFLVQIVGRLREEEAIEDGQRPGVAGPNSE